MTSVPSALIWMVVLVVASHQEASYPLPLTLTHLVSVVCVRQPPSVLVPREGGRREASSAAREDDILAPADFGVRGPV